MKKDLEQGEFYKNIPLNGKLITAEEPCLIDTNFQQLTNMRYGSIAPESISGMTKINSSVMDATYLKARSAFQFNKERKFTVKGTATSTSAGNLVDSAASFVTGNKVSAGDIVLNTTDNTQTTISAVTNGTTIDVVDDIFVSGDAYEIFPEESHILVQAYNTGLTASAVLDNQIAVPNTGEFDTADLWTDSTGAVVGTFSDAPQGQVAYCNGVDTLIWAGKEKNISKFINFNPNGTMNKDYTEPVSNTLDDANNVATLTKVAGTIDSYTKLLIHGSETVAGGAFTDSSTGAGRTVTFVGTQTDFSSTQTKFGAKSVYFDGTGDYLTCADHADFDLSGGIWTFDAWLYAESQTTTLYYHATDANNYMLIYTTPGGHPSRYAVGVKVVSGGATVVDFVTTSVFSISKWQHVEVAENGDNWYIFGFGAVLVSSTDTSRPADYTGTVYIGSNTSTVYTGYMDEVRLSVGTIRHTGEFTPETSAYGSDRVYLYAGFTRPVKGVKFYPKTVNTTIGTMTGYEWGTAGWTALTITDGTASGGIPLAKVGSVTFSSTVSTSKLKVINGIPLYWYRFEITNCDNTTTIYHVTGDCAVQPFLDIWDGTYRDVSSFQQYDTSASTYIDKTIEVVKDSYDSQNTATYTILDSMPTEDFLVVGFMERMMGVKISFVSGRANSTANTVASVYYSSDGDTWTTVGDIDDKTSKNAVSFNQSGIITWNPPTEINEFKREIAGERERLIIGEQSVLTASQFPTTMFNKWFGQVMGSVGNSSGKGLSDGTFLYYYKIQFSQALDSEVEVFHIAGIPAQKNIKGYNFPMYFDNRVALCGNKDRDKNAVLIGKTYTTEVYNGDDSTIFYVGDGSELTCGTQLFTQKNDGNYTVKLFFKKDQIWGLYGNSLQDYVLQCISSSDTGIGCVAPKTLKQVNLQVGDVAKKVVIFQASDGIYIYDNSEPIKVSNDIQNFWDKNESTTRRISTLYADRSYGFVDNDKQEYHWCFADGASTGTCNREFALDLQRLKWFEIDRTTGKYLQCGISVKDTRGNDYSYGFIDTGYMERLEYGTTLDGTNITSTMWTGDLLPKENAMTLTQLKRHKLTMKTKANTANNVAVTHYMDGKTTGTILDGTYDPTLSSYNLTTIPEDIMIQAEASGNLFHSFKYSLETSDESVGFQPLYIGTKFIDKGEEKV